jgi:hypothetical protein
MDDNSGFERADAPYFARKTLLPSNADFLRKFLLLLIILIADGFYSGTPLTRFHRHDYKWDINNSIWSLPELAVKRKAKSGFGASLNAKL